MENSYYRFDIGKFKCMIISDGWLMIPQPPAERAGGPPNPARGKRTDISCLLVDTGNRQILIDTGAGPLFQATAGKLAENMAAAGVRRDDIDTIIYTHSHGDHVGGTFDQQGKPMFPNARFVMSRSEWACLVDRPERKDQAGLFASARQNFLAQPSKFDLAENDHEVLPGIKMVTVPGHTPGNTTLEISPGDDQLLVVGDLIHLPLEFTRPDYYSFLDIVPDQAIRNRNKVLSQAASSGCLTFVCHFPFPGLGHFVTRNGVFGWEPLAGASDT